MAATFDHSLSILADDDGRFPQLDAAMASFTRFYLRSALIMCRGNQCKTAELLGVHRNTVTRLMEKLGIDPRDMRKIARELGGKR